MRPILQPETNYFSHILDVSCQPPLLECGLQRRCPSTTRQDIRLPSIRELGLLETPPPGQPSLSSIFVSPLSDTPYSAEHTASSLEQMTPSTESSTSPRGLATPCLGCVAAGVHVPSCPASGIVDDVSRGDHTSPTMEHFDQHSASYFSQASTDVPPLSANFHGPFNPTLAHRPPPSVSPQVFEPTSPLPTHPSGWQPVNVVQSKNHHQENHMPPPKMSPNGRSLNRGYNTSNRARM